MNKPYSAPVRFAVVGLRNIGCGHFRNAVGNPRLKAVSGVDVDAERRAHAAQAHGVTVSDSLEAVLADTSIDAVVLAVPTHVHVPLGIKVLQAGKHVLVEKPVAANAPDCSPLIAAAKSSGLVAMVGMNQRFSPGARLARTMIADGAIGKVHRVRTWWMRQQLADGIWSGRGAWGFTPGQGGGPLHDIGIHKLDLAMSILGFPAAHVIDARTFYGIGARIAQAKGRSYAIEDGAYLRISLAGDSVIDLECSNFAPATDSESNGVIIDGEAGTLIPGSDYVDVIRVSEDGNLFKERIVAQDTGPCSCIDHFARVILNEETLGPTLEQGQQLLRLLDVALSPKAQAVGAAL